MAREWEARRAWRGQPTAPRLAGAADRAAGWLRVSTFQELEADRTELAETPAREDSSGARKPVVHPRGASLHSPHAPVISPVTPDPRVLELIHALPPHCYAALRRPS